MGYCKLAHAEKTRMFDLPTHSPPPSVTTIFKCFFSSYTIRF